MNGKINNIISGPNFMFPLELESESSVAKTYIPKKATSKQKNYEAKAFSFKNKQANSEAITGVVFTTIETKTNGRFFRAVL